MESVYEAIHKKNEYLGDALQAAYLLDEALCIIKALPFNERKDVERIELLEGQLIELHREIGHTLCTTLCLEISESFAEQWKAIRGE